ncbi:MAG: DMT family transporter [Chloroflexi bacterium]|nr:MAG: DMT family transporter [Chloroflexota bacterium]
MQATRSPVRREVVPYLAILLGVTAVSFAAIFIRYAQREAPSLVIAAWRLTLASLVLAPTALTRYRQEIRRLTRRELGWAILSGLFLAGHFASWITSLAYTSVASSVVLVTTYPLFVGLISTFLLRDPATGAMWVSILMVTAGGAMIGMGDFGEGSNQLLGDLLAVIGAVTAAGYFLIGRRLRANLHLITYISVVYGAAAVFLIVFALVGGYPLFGYSPVAYFWFLMLALVPQLLGHSSFNFALRYLSATYVTITVVGEPVGSTVLAYFLLGEVPGLWHFIGGALILTGIVLASREERRIQAQREQPD